MSSARTKAWQALKRRKWITDLFQETRRTPADFRAELPALHDEVNARFTYRGSGNFAGEFIEALPYLHGKLIDAGWVEVDGEYQDGRTFISPLGVEERAIMVSTRQSEPAGAAEVSLVEVADDWGDELEIVSSEDGQPSWPDPENDPLRAFELHPSTFAEELEVLRDVDVRGFYWRRPQAFTPVSPETADRILSQLEQSGDWVRADDDRFIWQFGGTYNHRGHVLFAELMANGPGIPAVCYYNDGKDALIRPGAAEWSDADYAAFWESYPGPVPELWLQLHVELYEPEDFPSWSSGEAVEDWGELPYWLLVRAPGDPERSRSKRKDRDLEARWRQDLRKSDTGLWKSRILRQLGDGLPRTLNRLGVEMLDKTSDIIADTPFTTALLELNAAGLVEHTADAPFYWRLAGSEQETPEPLRQHEAWVADYLQAHQLGGGDWSDAAISGAQQIYIAAWDDNFDWDYQDQDMTWRQLVKAVVDRYWERT
jgi:hypothetical protein